ncbi:MAG: ABC transporter ATP-binding protein [Planctomycetes bacterium]|nr:ABC transporter ATP-binding protein [Planctomycetota bacterium]
MSDAGAAAPPAAILELRAIEKRYGTDKNPVPVLRGISLRVDAGEYVAIVGPSGSGKSTLLNILGCLDRPSGGSYFLAGDDVARMDDRSLSRVRNTRIGFVFQSFHLIPHLTVAENVELPLFYARVPRSQRRAKALEVLDKVGLSHRLKHVPNELSGGECQRTAIARALTTEPTMLLADEPTGNLDSVNSKAILQVLRDLHASGRTIVMITHDRDIAQNAPRRVALRDGLVETDSGKPAIGSAT